MKISPKTGARMQRMLWHLRWALLLFIVIVSVAAIWLSIRIETIFCILSVSWAVYFFIGQVEGYFECQANCKL